MTPLKEQARAAIMEGTDFDEGEFEFSRNYFLAKESGTSTKRSTHKLSDINIVDEQVLPQFLKCVYIF